MVKKKWGRVFATAMAAALTVTSVPISVYAEEETGAETTQENEANEADDGYNLVWSDEFDGDTLNTNDWNVEEHDPGWVNAEWQKYTSLDEGNIEVKDGVLHIIPKYVAGEEDSEGVEEESTERTFEHFSVNVNVGEDKPETNTIALQVNFGKIPIENDDEKNAFGDKEAALEAKAYVSLGNISLIDVTEGVEPVNMLDSEAWSCGFNENGQGTYDYTDGMYNIKIDNAGDANWHIQMQQSGLHLIPGHNYVFSMDAASDTDRVVQISALDPDNGYNWYGGAKLLISGSGKSGNAGNIESGESKITSGRITTQGKHDFTYGRFEARAKVPYGQGFLPAFWLMASDEGYYGQWPKCGEIDIMEVMGQETNKSYHTIHYGYNSGNGHKENQGTKTLTEGNFSDEYHVFRVDWEPGKIKWFVDDQQVYETSDWYTGTDDDNQITYPAPFDQNFYIILNLAVGGSWVGDPDLDEINGKAYEIDYVRVYQKSESEYEQIESGAERPEKEPVVYRDADESGNYVLNSDFTNAIAAENSEEGKNNWVLHLEKDAEGSVAEISNGAVIITPVAEGGQPHSVQLKQVGVPMYKGWEYELSFDAYSTQDRSIVVDIEGPDHGWVRYLQDTTVALGTNEQHYTMNFTMNEKTDANGSLEFNLGKQGSTAPVVIKNVKLIHKSGEEVKDDNEKVIRPDGNYVYNGSFDQGDKRLGYWEFDENDASQISVTKTRTDRELMVKVEVPEGASEANPVTISQSDLAPLAKGSYELSFNAYHDGGEADGLTVNVVGEEFVPSLTNEKTSFSKMINLENDLTRDESNIEFSFTKPGTYYLDDVFLTEKALLKNGSFSAGMAGWTPYIDGAAKANYVIDNMNGNDNTFAITIEDTGKDNDWYIQLNQDGLKIEEGKYYYVSFKAKSSMNRVIKYCLQKNGDDWANYSGTGEVEVGHECKTFSHAFQMTNATDEKTRFNITFGSIGGERIQSKHDVYIDDIELIELTKEEFDKLGSSENTEEEPTETPAAEPAETPSETPAAEPAETPAETPADRPAETPSVTPADRPAETPSETPAEVPSQKPVAQPESKPSTQGTNEKDVVNTPDQAAPAVEAETTNTDKPQSKLNNNGKAEKGEIRVTKNSIYKVTGKKTVSYQQNPDNVNKTVNVPSTVVVDGTKVKVTKITKNAFKGNKNLKKVTLGKNITKIGKGAFSGCTKLKKITVKGDKLKKVEKSAFKDCKLNKEFKVVIHAKDDESYEKVVKLFEDAGLKDVTFIRK